MELLKKIRTNFKRDSPDNPEKPKKSKPPKKPKKELLPGQKKKTSKITLILYGVLALFIDRRSTYSNAIRSRPCLRKQW